jgi:hypothetical protein
MHRSSAFLLFLVACGGAEPANDLLGRRANQPAPSGDVAATDPSPTSDTGAATASGPEAATTTSRPDSGTSAAPADPFTGAPSYVAQNGPNTIKDDHPFAGGNPAKQSCMQSQCHAAGGEGPTFLAGGTVYEDIAGTMPAAQIEVRLRDANGDARLARTDANGNFYFTAGNNTIDFPARTGARDGTATRNMISAVANGDCNSSACHGGATGVIHVP